MVVDSFCVLEHTIAVGFICTITADECTVTYVQRYLMGVIVMLNTFKEQVYFNGTLNISPLPQH